MRNIPWGFLFIGTAPHKMNPNNYVRFNGILLKLSFYDSEITQAKLNGHSNTNNSVI